MSTMIATRPELALPPGTLPGIEATPEELLEMPDGGHYELVDGELRERKVSALSNLVTIEISAILRNHCREHDRGWLFAADHGYRCFPWKPRQIRRADVAFFRKDRYPLAQLLKDGYTTIPPDLAVEVVSPNDGASEVAEKVQEYLRAGVNLVWLIYPETRQALVIRGDRSATWLQEGDELSGEDVVPGFRCRVGDLFPEDAEDPANPGPKPEPGQT
jgi:Uma2 family endonuclease